jgi:hypothetical protein
MTLMGEADILVQNPGGIPVNGQASLDNAGTLVKDGGGTSTVSAEISYTNTGTVTVLSGVLDLPPEGPAAALASFRLAPDATFAGVPEKQVTTADAQKSPDKQDDTNPEQLEEDDDSSESNDDDAEVDSEEHSSHEAHPDPDHTTKGTSDENNQAWSDLALEEHLLSAGSSADTKVSEAEVNAISELLKFKVPLAGEGAELEEAPVVNHNLQSLSEVYGAPGEELDVQCALNALFSHLNDGEHSSHASKPFAPHSSDVHIQ